MFSLAEPFIRATLIERRLTQCLYDRGEIAARILSTARELSLETFALQTPQDATHTLHATHVLPIPSAGSYLDIPLLLSLVKKHSITHIHPGYGFLSESADFAARAWSECGATVIGPGAEILARTGDKLAARRLAQECNVPVLPAMEDSTGDVREVESFGQQHGYPIMLKAVDGGGGRGIRLVPAAEDLAAQARVAIAESPSRRVFAERAAVLGFRHVEVQIIGDGSGAVRHLWERECSIQRRYQKVVEFAPASPRFGDRKLVKQVIESAVRMAEHIRYRSLGTFEFLANPDSGEYYFLEINPRLQVEHTVTEQVCGGIDLVAMQLSIAQGVMLEQIAELGILGQDPISSPGRHSIQLRLTAENPHAKWSLSAGKVRAFSLPNGNGIRVDTALHGLVSTTVTTDFDSLIAKIIVTAVNWEAAVAKARRALDDTKIEGIATNLEVLRSIVAHEDFIHGNCDTTWLEAKQEDLQSSGHQGRDKYLEIRLRAAQTGNAAGNEASLTGSSSSAVVLRKGDAWSVKLAGASEGQAVVDEMHHLKLLHLARNEFPNLLSATIAYSTPSNPSPSPLRLTISSTRASASAVAGTSAQRRGDPSDPRHVVIPFAGKLVEVCVDEGDYVKEGDVVCVVSQMKMELTVCARKAGRVKWLLEADDGEDVGEGALAAEIDLDASPDGQKARL